MAPTVEVPVAVVVDVGDAAAVEDMNMNNCNSVGLLLDVVAVGPGDVQVRGSAAAYKEEVNCRC